MNALEKAAAAAFHNYSRNNGMRMTWEDLAPSGKDAWMSLASDAIQAYKEGDDD